MNYSHIPTSDPPLYSLIQKEQIRQKEGIELIPSENYASSAVREPLGSILMDKYAEGYPSHRYYGGNTVIDEVETLAQERAKDIFDVPYVNVQPYSGSPANMAVYAAVANPGDTIMGQHLYAGGHLTHGWKFSMSGTYYSGIQYGVTKNGIIDYDEVEALAIKHHPVLIWCGASAYAKVIDFERFANIAEKAGAYLAADISHIAGLVAAGIHPSPVPYAHIVTTTTHKTLRGPRAAMIMVTRKGLQKDSDLSKKIDKRIFPGFQGGPHEDTIASIAVALNEVQQKEFTTYAKNILENARTLCEALTEKGYSIVGKTTENHLMLVDMRPKGMTGWHAEQALEYAGITVNKNTIPFDTNSPFYPSGIRLGTPAITSRGMKKEDMKTIARFIDETICHIQTYQMITSTLNADSSNTRKAFSDALKKDPVLVSLRKEVAQFASSFPIPGVDS